MRCVGIDGLPDVMRDHKMEQISENVYELVLDLPESRAVTVSYNNVAIARFTATASRSNETDAGPNLRIDTGERTITVTDVVDDRDLVILTENSEHRLTRIGDTDGFEYDYTPIEHQEMDIFYGG
eukprot:988321_1